MIFSRANLKISLRLFQFKILGGILPVVSKIFRPKKNKIIVTNDPKSRIDGTGAQIQRAVGSAAVSLIMNTQFMFTKIEDITVHPYDEIYTDEDKSEYLIEINKIFSPAKTIRENSKENQIICMDFYLSSILKVWWRSFFKTEPTLIKIVNPYPLLDYCPEFYIQAINQFTNFPTEIPKNERLKIGIHYRQGVGGQVVYPGQTIPRELNEKYFLSALSKLELDKSSDCEIVIFTDSPINRDLFSPPQNQIHLWEGTPQFQTGILEIKGNEFSELSASFPNITIKRGGNPLNCILEMSTCNYLIIGRSSLSYFAALIPSEKKVIYPKDFWHKPLKDWIILNPAKT